MTLSGSHIELVTSGRTLEMLHMSALGAILARVIEYVVNLYS